MARLAVSVVTAVFSKEIEFFLNRPVG